MSQQCKEGRHDFLDPVWDGRPQIFDGFMASVIDRSGHADMILPAQATHLASVKLVLWLKAEIAFWS
jgi:hypothetical protein